jgi:hypothetical protein
MWQAKSFQAFLLLNFALMIILIGGLIECVENMLSEEEGKVAKWKNVDHKE